MARWLSHTTLLVLVVLVPMLGGLLGAHGGAPASVVGLPVAARAADAPAAAISSRGFIVKPSGLGQTAQSHRDVITYSVQNGDVLGAIAEKYGLRIDTLRQTNELADVDTLALGQELVIPPTNGILIKVAAGDTVPTLADRYHVDAATVIGYNAIRNPLQLVAGTFVMIPDGTGFTASQDAGATPSGQGATQAAAPSAPHEIPHGRSAYNHFRGASAPTTWPRAATSRGTVTPGCGTAMPGPRATPPGSRRGRARSWSPGRAATTATWRSSSRFTVTAAT